MIYYSLFIRLFVCVLSTFQRASPIRYTRIISLDLSPTPAELAAFSQPIEIEVVAKRFTCCHIVVDSYQPLHDFRIMRIASDRFRLD